MDFYQDFPIFQCFFFHFFPYIFPIFSHDFPQFSPYFPMFFPIFPIFSHDFPVVHPQMGRLSGPGDCAGGGLPRRPGGRRLAAAPRRAGLAVAGGECRGGARRQGLAGKDGSGGGEKM